MSLNRPNVPEQKNEIIRQIQIFITDALFSKNPSTRNIDAVFKALDQSTLSPDEKIDCLTEKINKRLKWWEYILNDSYPNVTFGLGIARAALPGNNAEVERFISYLIQLNKEGASRYKIHMILRKQLLYGWNFFEICNMRRVYISFNTYFLLLKNDLIFPESYAHDAFKSVKRGLLQHILSLPLDERQTALHLAIDPATTIGGLFWTKRLYTKPGKHKGTLAKIYSELEKIELAIKWSMTTKTLDNKDFQKKQREEKDKICESNPVKRQSFNDDDILHYFEMVQTSKLNVKDKLECLRILDGKVPYTPKNMDHYSDILLDMITGPGSAQQFMTVAPIKIFSPTADASIHKKALQLVARLHEFNVTREEIYARYESHPELPYIKRALDEVTAKAAESDQNVFALTKEEIDALNEFYPAPAKIVYLPVPYPVYPQPVAQPQAAPVSLIDFPLPPSSADAFQHHPYLQLGTLSDAPAPIAVAADMRAAAAASVATSPPPSYGLMSVEERVERYVGMYQSSFPLFTSELPALAAAAGAAAPVVAAPPEPSNGTQPTRSMQIQKRTLAFAQ